MGTRYGERGGRLNGMSKKSNDEQAESVASANGTRHFPAPALVLFARRHIPRKNAYASLFPHDVCTCV